MEEPNSMEEISLRDIFDVLVKWRWMIFILTATAMITSAIFAIFFTIPTYRSSAILMVTHADTQRVFRSENELAEVVDQVSRPQDMNLITYVSQLSSTVLLERVIQKLGLSYSPRSLSGMVKTSVVKDTRLIEVGVEHNDPYTAALIANTLSEEFINFISDINQQHMGRSLDFLEQQQEEVKLQLTESTEKYQEYEKDPRGVPIVKAELDSKINDVIKYKSQIVQTQIEFDQLLAGRNELQRRLDQESSGIPNLFAGADGEEAVNPVYISLRQSIDEKNVQLNEKQALVKSLEKAVIQLEQQIQLLQVELNEKNAFEKQMDREIERLEKTLGLFTDKITQAQITQSIDLGANNLTLMVRAVEPGSPVKPNKKMNIALAGILAVMSSVMLAFLLEFLDNSIKNDEDVRRHLSLPVLAHVPKF